LDGRGYGNIAPIHINASYVKFNIGVGIGQAQRGLAS
jgi:hypothetical protein